MVTDTFKLPSSHKGLSFSGFLKQMMAHFMNGDQMTLVDFDHRKKDEGYGEILETTTGKLASSHQIKRYFIKLRERVIRLAYRKVLYELFI